MAEPAQKIPNPQPEQPSGDQNAVNQSPAVVVHSVKTTTIYTNNDAVNDNNQPGTSSVGSAGQTPGQVRQGSGAGSANVSNNGQSDSTSPSTTRGDTASNNGEAAGTPSNSPDASSSQPSVNEPQDKKEEGKKGDEGSKKKGEDGKEGDATKDGGKKTNEGKEGEEKKDEEKGKDEKLDSDKKADEKAQPEETNTQPGEAQSAQRANQGAKKPGGSANLATQSPSSRTNVNQPSQPQRPAGIQPGQKLPQRANSAQVATPGNQGGRQQSSPVGEVGRSGREKQKLDGKDRPEKDEQKAASTQEGSGDKAKVSTDKASKLDSKTEGGGIGGKSGGLKDRAVKKTVGKAVDKVGSALGLSPVKKQFLIHIVVLVLELISGIGTLLFIFHVIGLIIWVFQKGRWRELGGLLILLAGVVITGLLTIFMTYIIGFSVIACSIGQSRIPFNIPMSVVSRIGSWYHSDTGYFAQLCNQLNVLSGGVGESSSSGSSGARTGGTTTLSDSASSGLVLVDTEGTISDTPVIPNTLLTRPQSLPAEFAAQTNQAGYVSPVQCQLSDLPYSNETSLQRVALPDGTTTVITLPIHQTIDCKQNDPTKVSVRSVHTGKIVRLVYADEALGDYATIEYPNNLRVSYYHMQLLPELTLGKTVNAGESIGRLAQSGGGAFEGVTMRFEYKLANGSWQVFNPISSNLDASILTTFPCADDAMKNCLLL